MRELIDQHGRKVRKLRLSLTDKCNLRCHYCMPENPVFMDESSYLTPHEYQEIIAELCDYGLEELRLTGGEPLLRKSLPEILAKLSPLPLKKIGLTTNGIFLDKYLEILKDLRVHHLNISLDSLNDANFTRITKGNHLSRILKNIEAAQKMNFLIKLNVVAMKGVNDHELFNFVDYAKQTGIEVRFLELMRIGEACSSQKEQFISANELTKRLKTRYIMKSIVKEMDSTSFNYLLENGAQIGFIASESQPFCGQCSRWRLSADGVLRACLLKDDGLSIRKMSSSQREATYQQLLGMKPNLRPQEVKHYMNTIGG